jgi:L-alanine-DL-glutamate epimerase-like enolase superfamily enzyme
VRTDDGVEGIGYAGFVPKLALPALKAMMDGLAGLAIGMDALDHEAVAAKLLMEGGFGSPGGLVMRSTAAIETALWDVKGKALSQPVYKLLGGLRSRVPCYASGYMWRNHDLANLAETGPKLVEQGFRAMKFRMGDERSHRAELERLRVLREAVGPDIELMVDINQGWDVNRAVRIGRAMEQYDLYWLEDPTHFEDFEGLAKIAAALDTPVTAGEYLYGVASFANMLRRGSVDIAMIDHLRAGGLAGFMKIAHIAEGLNIPAVSHLAPEIAAHAVAAAPNGLMVELMPWSAPLFEQALNVQTGEIVLSDAPGFGLSFDEKALTHYAA